MTLAIVLAGRWGSLEDRCQQSNSNWRARHLGFISGRYIRGCLGAKIGLKFIETSTGNAFVDTAAPGPATDKTLVRIGFSTFARHWRWVLFYALTVLGLLGWYEILPRMQAYWLLQGDWQFTSGALHTEKLENAFLHFENGSSVALHGTENGWRSRKSSYRLVPARNFYRVTRTWTYGKPGRYYDADYIVCFQDDKLFQLFGVAELDNQRTPSTTRLRRASELPAGAREQLKNTP
jgi:hypothetical protein